MSEIGVACPLQIKRFSPYTNVVTKDFVNDQLFREKKAVILQDEMERITDTLFDHRLRKVSKDKG